jgi:hypothetical protein
MGMMINPRWAQGIRDKLNAGGTIDETISFNKAAQWLIEVLSHMNKPFAVYNIGAGVKRITTVTDTCPCCKRKL